MNPSEAGGDSASAYTASGSSRGSSRSRNRPARSSRRPNNSSSGDASAPRTPDNSSSRKHAAPVTAVSTGRISSGGRAARRAGSAAAAAFAALSPRGRNRAEPLRAGGAGDRVTALGRGGSDRSIPALPEVPVPLAGMLPADAGEEPSRFGALELPVSRLPGGGGPRLPQTEVRGTDVDERLSDHPGPRRIYTSPLPGHGSRRGAACGPVGEAAAVRALNSGLVRQGRHVFGRCAPERSGPAAVGGNTSSSSSAESISAGAGAAGGAGPLTRVAAAAAVHAPAAALEPQRVGEIDLALSVVSVDSVRTDGGSHDGATVSLSTWKNGASLCAHAAAGGDSMNGDGAGAARVEADGDATSASAGSAYSMRQGKRWRSAVRRLQRGNTRMLQLLRSRGQE